MEEHVLKRVYKLNLSPPAFARQKECEAPAVRGVAASPGETLHQRRCTYSHTPMTQAQPMANRKFVLPLLSRPRIRRGHQRKRAKDLRSVYDCSEKTGHNRLDLHSLEEATTRSQSLRLFFFKYFFVRYLRYLGNNNISLTCATGSVLRSRFVFYRPAPVFFTGASLTS